MLVRWEGGFTRAEMGSILDEITRRLYRQTPDKHCLSGGGVWLMRESGLSDSIF